MNKPIGIPSGWEEIAAYMSKNGEPSYKFSVHVKDMVECGADYYFNMPDYEYDWREEP